MPGDFAYKLYDTYGLNSEVICKLAEIESIPFDLNAFKDALERAKQRSRDEFEKSDNEIISDYSINLLESEDIPKTDDSLKYDYTYDDKGYHFPIVKSKLLGMVMNGNILDKLLVLQMQVQQYLFKYGINIFIK